MRTHAVSKLARGAQCVVLFAALTGFALPALADPPSHAPAHGWRKKHDPYYVGYTGHQWERDYGIIEGRCDRAVIGAVLGAAVGGAIGSQVGDGSSRAVAIVLGTVIGAVIGREIGRELDEADRACVGHALELAQDGQGVRWLNESSGVTYLLTPIGAAQEDNTCRDFELRATLDDETTSRRGRACRTEDGAWQMSP